MPTKKLQGDLNVTGDYAQNGAKLVTTAGLEYDSTDGALAGAIKTYDGSAYRCLEDWGGNFTLAEFSVANISPDRSYSPEAAGALEFAYSTATPTFDDATTTITLAYSTPTWSGIVLGAFVNFARNDAIRAILWPNSNPDLGLAANVAFHDFVLDASDYENGVMTLSCFSPLCTLVVASNAAEGSEGTTVTIAFNAVGASIYALLKTIMQGGQYPGITLIPVLAFY